MGEHWMMSYVTRMKHPLLLILASGLLIRFLLIGFSYEFDSDYWSVVIRNMEAGYGLYELVGYYYTPVWGYILSLIGAFQTMFLDFGETSVMLVEALFVKGTGPYTAMIPSVTFLFLLKVPLYLCDLITAYLVMRMVREETGDDDKALLGFALTFLAPVLFLSAGIATMPDTISAMFAVLTVYLVRRNHYFIAGMTFSMAFLVKFFPAFLIFVLVAYIVSTNHGNRRVQIGGVVQAAVGFIMMFIIILMPQIIAGDVTVCFQFLSDRMGGSVSSDLFSDIAGYLRIVVYFMVIIVGAIIGYLAYRDRVSDPFDVLMRGCLIIVACVLIYPPSTQYMALLVPFLAYWIAVHSPGLTLAWKVMGVGACLFLFATNAMLLMPFAVWVGIFDVGALVDIYAASCEGLFFGVTMKDLIFAIGGTLQCLSVVMVLWHFYGDRILAIVRSRGSKA